MCLNSQDGMKISTKSIGRSIVQGVSADDPFYTLITFEPGNGSNVIIWLLLTWD